MSNSNNEENTSFCRRAYMIVLNRETFEYETWSYGGYEEYHINPSTNIYIGRNIDEMAKFIKSYFHKTAWRWHDMGHPMFHSGYDGTLLNSNALLAKLYSLVFVDVSPVTMEDFGEYNTVLACDYHDRRYLCSEFRNEEMCGDDSENFIMNACRAALTQFGQEWKQIAEENKKSEEKAKKAKEEEEKLGQEARERELYERLKAKFDAAPVAEG